MIERYVERAWKFRWLSYAIHNGSDIGLPLTIDVILVRLNLTSSFERSCLLPHFTFEEKLLIFSHIIDSSAGLNICSMNFPRYSGGEWKCEISLILGRLIYNRLQQSMKIVWGISKVPSLAESTANERFIYYLVSRMVLHWLLLY